MWLIGSTFEIESCGRSRFSKRKKKDSNSLGPRAELRRRTKSGIFSRVSFRKGKRNESCKQEDAEDAKKKNSPRMFWNTLLWELSARVQFRSSLPEIFPKAEESLRKLHKTRLRNNGSHRVLAWQSWGKLLFLARGEYCVKCHVKPSCGTFLLPLSLSHTCGALRHVKKAHTVYYSHTSQEALPQMIMSAS